MLIVIDILGTDEDEQSTSKLSADEQLKNDLELKKLTLEELLRRAPQPQLIEVER